MKAYIITLALFFTATLTAQIGKVSESEKLSFVGEKVNLFSGYGINGKAHISFLKSSCEEQIGCLYALSFQNQEYNQIQDIQEAYFTATTEELDYLFNEMKKVFKFKKDISIPIGKNTMKVSYIKDIDKSIMVIFSGEANGYFKVNSAALYYLFGKKKEWNKKSWKAFLKS